jgi:hypothetical protein
LEKPKEGCTTEYWETDKQIKKYRKKQEIFLVDNSTKRHYFVNPTKETPVETSRFLRFLDLGWVDPILKELFPRFNWIKHRLYPRVKLVLFMKLRPDIRKVSELHRVIQSTAEIAKNLGFDPQNLPGYETIRHFKNDLLDYGTLEYMFYIQVKEIERQLNRYGERLGEKTLEDATIITSKRGDLEAEYSGYYEDRGWKKDLLLDQKHKVFLAYQNLGINENEGHALPSNLEKLQEIDINVNEITADGKYPTYENIAVAKHKYGTDLFYRPQDDWVHNDKGDMDEINKRYQKYWKHRDFRVNATLKYKLRFLYKRGGYEWVGAYYRNQHVRRYNSRIKHCMKRYRTERNTNESFNNYLKQHMGFETSLPQKGKGSAFKHTTLCLIAINAAALTRLQNGETEHLTSVAYFT